jgi:hypothetical protein
MLCSFRFKVNQLTGHSRRGDNNALGTSINVFSRKTSGFANNSGEENLKQISSAGSHAPGRRVARALHAPSRDALRGILRGDAKRALDCANARAG